MMDLKHFLSPLIKNLHNTVWILHIEVSVYYPTIITIIWPTLQGVENGEEVHEHHSDRAPSKEGKAPCHAEEEGEADDAAQVTQHLLLKCAVVALSIPATDLHHHHNKHGHIQEEDDAKVGHACHVEHNLAPNPAADETQEMRVISLMPF